MLPDFCPDGALCAGEPCAAGVCQRMETGEPLPAFGERWPNDISEVSALQLVDAMTRAVNSSHHGHADCGCQCHAVLDRVRALLCRTEGSVH